MKKINRKLVLVLAILLSAVWVLSACDKSTPPADTTDNQNTVSAEVTDASSEGETDPSSEGETDSAEDTQPSVSDTLNEAEATALLQKAIAATEKKNAYQCVMSMGMSMGDMDLGVTKITETTDGAGHIFLVEAEGVKTQYVILSDKVYITETFDGETAYTVVTLENEEQKAYVMEMYGEGMSKPGSDMSADQFVGLSGKRNSDGSVTLTATGLSDELLSELLGETEETMGEMTLNLKSATLTVNAAGLLSGMTLDADMSSTISEGGMSMEFSVSMTVSMTVDYGTYTVFTPDNTTEYEEVSFEEYFLYWPSEEEAALAGLPLDQDSYIIGAEDSEYSVDDQMIQLSIYPQAYEGKTFTVYGVVSEAEDDEGNVMTVLSVGEFMLVRFHCAEGVTAPEYGDSVKITATFERVSENAYGYSDYSMKITACEVLAKGVGPNGGRIMYVTTGALNVRTSSDTSSTENILGTLTYGDAVEVFDQDENGWWRIEFNGQTAYISYKYVSETKPEA